MLGFIFIIGLKGFRGRGRKVWYGKILNIRVEGTVHSYRTLTNMIYMYLREERREEGYT